jgi:signal transduction histidine kinase
MPGRTRFETTAKTGFAVLALLLAVGMTFSVRRLASVADAQIKRIRADEYAITLVERLRWNAALVVSHGRGYLIAGEPELLGQIEEAKAGFHETLGLLRGQALDAQSAEAELIGEAEQAASAFTRGQDDLLAARGRSEDTKSLVRRFETELLPLRRALNEALSRLVGSEEATLEERYRQAKEARVRLERGLYALIVLLVLCAVGVARTFTRILSGAYRQEATANEAARRALVARDELMGVVAHDLRSPLGAIALKAGLLRKRAESERTREQAESIAKVAARMESLIRTMLDVATIEAGRLTVNVGTCAAEELLRETMEVFAPLAGARNVVLEEAVRVPGLALRADQERVLQVLSNLVGNAMKFTPEGGRVTLSLERDADMARFGVRDTGPGIPPENLPRIFERYWKAETLGQKGTGLGLFIAKGIVDAHGGRIWAESGVAGGATFYFTLPVTDARERRAS